MPDINILSPHVADLIAAGEVVERPASVVKELMENSVDAGAKNITVEISRGGMGLIRVTDDGCGMSPDDAGIAFLRHATSKLADERGLESISTLGFRGEALAAISSVSHILLRTRRAGAAEGTRVELSAGDIIEMGPEGCPEGSSMEVRDLFYNTPARLKFMKSDRAETGACVNAALRCALGHPEVSVRFIRDGQEEFFTPGDGQAKSAVYSLLGRETAMSLLECSGGDEGVSVSGFVSAPHACRGNRSLQFFFINGRPFRSLTIQAALEQAYKNTMLVGRFPACVLYISLSHSRVDVNVHPTKSEVKFSEEKKVFDAVYYAVLSTLEARTKNTAEIKLSPGTVKAAQPKPDFFKTMTAEQFRAEQAKKPAAPSLAPLEKGGGREAAGGIPTQTRMDLGSVTKALFPELDKPAPVRVEAPRLTLRSPESEYSASPLVPKPDIPVIKAAGTGVANGYGTSAYKTAGASPHPTAAESMPAAPLEKGDVASPALAPLEKGGCHEVTGGISPDFRLIGEALNTYILVETEGSLLLIDKHAAHERDIFDRIRSDGGIMSQSLLLPLTWTPGAETVEILEQNAGLLERLGFEIEPYGENAVIIRAVPADTDGSELALLEELTAKLQNGRAENPTDEIYHTIACKAAIKAGWNTDPRELMVLAEKVVSGQVRYCPHGRPVSVVLTRAELDKFFNRIV